MAGLPRFRARACRVAPQDSNVKVVQSTRALSKRRSGPCRAFLISRGGHAPCGAMPQLSYTDESHISLTRGDRQRCQGQQAHLEL